MPDAWARRESGRARFTLWVWLAAFSFAGLLAPCAVVGQVRPDTLAAPADTAAADTALVPIPPGAVAGDTLPSALADSATAEAEVPVVVPYPEIRTGGWAAERWAWTREELARMPGLTLREFLEQVPGIMRFRAGGFGRPAGMTALGAGGGRVRLFLDGFEVDPLGYGSPDLDALAVFDMSALRVERTASGIRVDVETYRLHRPEPYSIVGLGTGSSQVRLLRALFSRAVRRNSILTGAFDIASTGGLGIAEEYSQSNAAFRFSHGFSDDFGVEAEWRRTALDRAGDLYPRQLTRSDMILRVRRRFADRVVVETFAGHTTGDEDQDPAIPGSLGTDQVGFRSAYSSERLGVELSARLRDRGDPPSTQPALDGEFRSHFRPFPGLRVEMDGRIATYGDLDGREVRVLGALSPASALTLFGSLSGGTRLVPFFLVSGFPGEEQLELSLAGLPRLIDVGGWRAGAELAGGRGSIGVAAFRAGGDIAVPFGLPFDRGSPAIDITPSLGTEAYLDLAIPATGGALRVGGWYTMFEEWEGRLYTPEYVGRAALTFHDTYYENQLEPSIRFEGVFRGAAMVPDPQDVGSLVSTERSQTLNFSLHLRIIDVQAFMLWENLLNTQTAIDLPGSPPAFPRIVYGASWQFSN